MLAKIKCSSHNKKYSSQPGLDTASDVSYGVKRYTSINAKADMLVSNNFNVSTSLSAKMNISMFLHDLMRADLSTCLPY